MNMPKEEFQQLMTPSSVFCLTTVAPDGYTYVAPFNWVCLMSYEPQLIAFSSKKPTTITLDNARNTGFFAVSRPRSDKALTQKLLQTCDRQYRDKDRAKLLDIKLETANSSLDKKLVPQVLYDRTAYCIASMKLEVELGDHILVVGEVVDGFVDVESHGDALLYVNKKTFAKVGELFNVAGY